MALEIRGTTKPIVAVQLALFILAAALLIPAISPGVAMTGGAGIKLLFLARIAALVALATWLLRSASLDWSDVGFKRPDRRRFLIAFPVGLLLAVVASVIAGRVIALTGLKSADYSMFAPITGNLGEYLFWLLPVSIGTAAFGEELLFRGFVLDRLCRLTDARGTAMTVIMIAVQAVIFGALHYYQGLGGVITAGSIGFVLGLTWLIAGRNLWPGIIIHALLDGSAMTAFYLGLVKAG